MSRQRSRSSSLSGTWNSLCGYQLEFRTVGLPYGDTSWNSPSGPFYYSTGPHLYNAQSFELMDDVIGNKKGDNTVDHVRYRLESTNPSWTAEYHSLPGRKTTHLEWDWWNQEWATCATEWRVAIYKYNYNWIPLSYPNGLPSIGHVMSAQRYQNSIASIVNDASQLYPQGDNIGLIVGEALEFKSLLDSLKSVIFDFSSFFTSAGAISKAKHAAKGASTSYLAGTWGVIPNIPLVGQISSMNDRLYARIAELQKRKNDKHLHLSRVWTESTVINIEGQEATLQTVNRMSVKMHYAINFDEESLCTALIARLAGVTSILETLWALVPLSFSVDGLFRAWGQNGIGDLAKSLDSEMDKTNQLVNDIQLPDPGEIQLADWSLSQKTTCDATFYHEFSVIHDAIPELPAPRYEARAKYSHYTRTKMNVESCDHSSLGMSPSMGLAASLGVVVINGRLGR